MDRKDSPDLCNNPDNKYNANRVGCNADTGLPSGRPAERVALWDNVKFVMIILMAVGHFSDCFAETSDTCRSIYLFIYAFHMPMFIFISGLFFSEKDSSRKIVYYASCGFALKICLSITALITNKPVHFALLRDSGLPWFMFTLAAFQALMLLFRNVNKTFLLVLCTLIACFAGYDKSIGDYLYLSRIAVFLPFFLAGTVIKQQTLIDFIKKQYRILLPLSVIVLSLWFCLCFFKLEEFYIYRHLLTGKNPFNKTVVDYGPLARLLCYFISFATGFSILVLFPKRRIPVMTSLGTRTLNVYFWHWPVYRLLETYLGIDRLFELSFPGKAAFLLTAVLLSVFLMSVRVFDYPLRLIKKYCFESGTDAGR